MDVREITNKEEWEGFLAERTEKTFLQSWNWGELQIKSLNKIWRFGIYNGENLLAVFMAVKISAKRAVFLYIPHGPVVIENLPGKDKKEILEAIMLRLVDIAKEEGASFIRVSPILERSAENQNVFADLGFREAPMHASAYEATWKLDLNISEEELLKNMRKTTRYLIKKTEANPDISVEISNSPDKLAVYQKLNRDVAKRQKFIGFSDEFIKNEFEAMDAVFVFGKYKGETVAGAMIIFWGQVGFYHQAASLGKFAKLDVPYLLQWEAIKEAKRRGCNVYDFWGFTDPEKFPKHPWAGPTLFKMGFGGYKKEYIKTQDFVISQKYWINYIIEKLRKIKRHL